MLREGNHGAWAWRSERQQTGKNGPQEVQDRWEPALRIWEENLEVWEHMADYGFIPNLHLPHWMFIYQARNHSLGYLRRIGHDVRIQTSLIQMLGQICGNQTG